MDTILKLSQLNDAARAYAENLAEKALLGATPEYRRKFEESIICGFTAGALWAVKDTKDEIKEAMAEGRYDYQGTSNPDHL